MVNQLIALLDDNSAQKPSGTARKKEQEKQHKYDAIAKDLSILFLPFVMESYGGLGTDATKVLSMLIPPDSSPLANVFSLPDLPRELRTSIAVALQQGNALALMIGLSHSRSPFTRNTLRAGRWD